MIQLQDQKSIPKKKERLLDAFLCIKYKNLREICPTNLKCQVISNCVRLSSHSVWSYNARFNSLHFMSIPDCPFLRCLYVYFLTNELLKEIVWLGITELKTHTTLFQTADFPLKWRNQFKIIPYFIFGFIMRINLGFLDSFQMHLSHWAFGRVHFHMDFARQAIHWVHENVRAWISIPVGELDLV